MLYGAKQSLHNMIYFDNSATTLIKPKQVGEAVNYAINHFGNTGRSFYDCAMLSSREIYAARSEIAKLTNLDDPLNVAFTSSATESLNLVIGGLIKPEDSVITTVLEHNSVLRPLYLKGCAIDFLNCGDNGNLLIDSMQKLIKPATKYFICTHGSNVTGNINDVSELYDICKSNNITMILDVSQTLGSIDTNIDMADILCFTGHKGLFGPQGTGGIIVNGSFPFEIVKTGGAGADSFAALQSREMPDIFEVGTLNSHGIYGLQKGVEFINSTGIEKIHEKEMRLTCLFYENIKDFEKVKIYGDFSGENRLPIVSLNIDGLSASELAGILWENNRIATRAGSHCAPLLHKRFKTVDTGMVRFSFSFFNTEDEIESGVNAIKNILRNC